MARIKPFKAHRPKSEFISEITCVPYDVVDTEEAANLAEGKPKSFLHVIRPEIDLQASVNIYDTEVYEKGKENLDRLLSSEAFLKEQDESIYIYRLTWKKNTQTGIFSCVNVADYDNGVILKHELTRPDKEDDRTRHILTQQAHAEPVMMTFRSTKAIANLIDSATETEPIYDFEAGDGVRHTIWKASDHQPFVKTFSPVPYLYIADGHHRCASASRAAHEMEAQNPEHTGEEEYNFFPAVLFPMDQMNILPYNRIIYSLPDNFFEELSLAFPLTENANPVPQQKGAVSVYYDGKWYGINLPDSKENDAASKLDVARLQEYILEPLLGISNQRTDDNIFFVGGIKGTGTLEQMVDSGKAQLAISLYATSIEELATVSDEGLLMPPKSTWFEPKLRSGFLIHTF